MTRVLAIVVAYNEADVLDATLRGLVEQGCDAVVVDDGSTDGTVEIAESWIGRGVIAVERRRDSGRMVWTDLLRRRAQLVREHDYDWYVFNDADEFREAPWPGLTFAEGLAKAERLGFDAVNFRVLNFRPTGPGFEPGGDPRTALTHFEPADPCDSPQVKAFKRPAGPLDLLRTGGHDVRFEGRRVCPVPFILRHYPIRSPEHGRRKVLAERLPRFAAEERANGWHVQYDELVAAGAEFTWDAAELVEWAPDRVRAELLAAAAETLLTAVQTRGTDLATPQLDHAGLREWAGHRGGEPVAPAAYRRARSGLDRVLAGEDPALVAQADLPAAPLVLRLMDALNAQLEVAGQVTELAVAHAARKAFAAAAAPPEPLAGARAFVALVDADEALAAPELVAAFGTAFDASDDATLVFCAPGWSTERLEADLGGLVAGLGLDGPFSPDLLAVPDAPSQLAARAGAVLSAAAPAGPLAAVPHVDAAGAGELRRLAGVGA